MTRAAAGLERIKHLEAQLAAAPVQSRQHHTLTVAIRSEAAAYRKSLDDEQTTATHDANPLAGVGNGSLKGTSVFRTPILVARRRIHSRSGSAARR